MSQNKVSDYVKKNLDRGVDIKDIKKALSKAGWSKQEIKQGINLLNKEPSDPTFRDKDYGKYISGEKKSNNKALIVFALVVVLLIVLGYFIFPRYDAQTEKQGEDDIEMQGENQDEEQQDENLEERETTQVDENQEEDNEAEEETLLNESPEEEQEPAGCVEEYYKMCYFGDVYWYDSCYNRGEIVQECGGDCLNGTCIACEENIYKKCYSGDLYWYDPCNIRGNRIEECDYGCMNSRCLNQTEAAN
jgi:hypothetical protein